MAFGLVMPGSACTPSTMNVSSAASIVLVVVGAGMMIAGGRQQHR